MRRPLALLILGVVALGAGAARGQEFSDERVGKAIEKAAGYLLSRQNADGSWPDSSGGLQIEGRDNLDRRIGATSLATYALLAKGVKLDDPKIAQALKWLEDQETGWTYAVTLRCQVWMEAVKANPNEGKYRRLLARDAKLLIEAAVAGKKKPGSYGYRVDFRRHSLDDADNSNAQYGVLGVWAAHLLEMEVPDGYWKAVMQYWASCQQRDGGWKYKDDKPHSTGTMTAAGLATMFVCVDALMAEKYVRCQRSEEIHYIRRGLAWFDKNYVQTLKDDELCWGGFGDRYYYLFGVERVGLACGYKYFGKVDWYRAGAGHLLDSQREDGAWVGSWGEHVATAYALLFLVRGQRAVLFNWLDYDGDWNNRPRALANFCRWGRTAFENRDVNWQIINTQVDVSEWHDAPSLLITGSTAPKFSDGDLEKLRTFVQQGGTIFSVAECKGEAFEKGIRDVYGKLFPAYKIEPIGNNHPFFEIDPHLVGKTKLSIVSNGARALAIHSDEDLLLPWQLSNYRSQLAAFDTGAAVIRYITDWQLRNRGATTWPAEPKRVEGPTVKVVRVKHGGNWDPEPLAWQRVARLMPRLGKVNVELLEPADMAALPSSGAQLAAMTGTVALNARDPDKAALKRFVESGGMLLVDVAGGAAGGGKAFAESIEVLLDETFGRRAARALSVEADLYRRKDFPITKVQYTKKTGKILGDNAPRLRGVLLNGRPAVLYSREDLTTALLGRSRFGVDGYRPDSALDILRNVILEAGKVKPK